nr:hypothetical protein CFP56_00365 [Quercus suber]
MLPNRRPDGGEPTLSAATKRAEPNDPCRSEPKHNLIVLKTAEGWHAPAETPIRPRLLLHALNGSLVSVARERDEHACRDDPAGCSSNSKAAHPTREIVLVEHQQVLLSEKKTNGTVSVDSRAASKSWCDMLVPWLLHFHFRARIRDRWKVDHTASVRWRRWHVEVLVIARSVSVA